MDVDDIVVGTGDLGTGTTSGDVVTETGGLVDDSVDDATGG